jgi:hypothetical protein
VGIPQSQRWGNRQTGCTRIRSPATVLLIGASYTLGTLALEATMSSFPKAAVKKVASTPCAEYGARLTAIVTSRGFVMVSRCPVKTRDQTSRRVISYDPLKQKTQEHLRSRRPLPLPRRGAAGTS